MAEFEIRLENYIPLPGDKIVRRSSINSAHVNYVTTFLTIRRPGLANRRKLVYGPDPMQPINPDTGKANNIYRDAGPIEKTKRDRSDRSKPFG